jgi:membrane protease YdiL (CAAX protease family)
VYWLTTGHDDPALLFGSGPLLSLSLAAATPLQIAIIYYAVNLRTDPKNYLALKWPSPRELTVGILAIAAIVAGYDGLNALLGLPLVSQFQTQTYDSASKAGWLLELWLAFAFVAPVGEEIVFRGFAYRAYSDFLGPKSAIIIISAVWALMHLQYDWLGIAQVFGVGILLGAARAATGSVVLPIIMHALMNFWGLLETANGGKWPL